jgi:ParB/RepB/Spo0J family partition protein
MDHPRDIREADVKIKIDAIHPNPQQPRSINPEKLENLTESIRQVGLINPIAVEDNGDATYTLIDGEHRWRACKAAGLTEIEAYVKSGRNGNGEQLRLAESISANMQRSDMNVIEQAKAIQDLFDTGYTLIEVMKITGLSQSVVRLRLELLEFSPVIQDLFANQRLPMSTRIIFAIKRMPRDETTDRLLLRFAARNMTEGKILMQFTLIEHGTRTGKRKHAQLDPQQSCEGALSMTGSKNVPEFLKTNVSAVCERCGMNSREICRNCPMTDLVDHWK